MNDPYQILNIPPTATDEEVKRAYRDLARNYRPNGFRSVHTANFDDSACLRCCAAWSCCTLFSGGGCYLLPCIYY